MRAAFRLTFLFGSLALLGGCTPSSSSSPSTGPSASPSEPAVGGFPPGCRSIDLRDPNGERIVLDGPWLEVVEAGEPMTWWIRSQGDCVWGAGYIDEVPLSGEFAGQPGLVQSLSGVIGSDFVINGEILFLGPFPPGASGTLTPYSPLRMLIEFGDAGELLLREDREPGVRGPRCPEPLAYCPDPLILQPAGEGR